MSTRARRSTPRVCVAMVAAAWAACVCAPSVARAEPDAARIEAAAEEYDRGRRAFLNKDYVAAATHFENAYRDAPRAEALRSAMRAHGKALRGARAATLAAFALRHHGGDAETATLASATLAEHAKTLGSVAIRCGRPCAVTVDGRVASLADDASHEIYLNPGPHELGVGAASDASASRRFDVVAGERHEWAVIFREAAKAPVGPALAAPSRRPIAEPAKETAKGGKPLGRAVFYTLAGLTLVSTGLTVASGIDTLESPGADAVRRECFGQGESCPLYAEGREKQLRTNVLIGTSAGLGALTAVVALWLTDWGGSRSPHALRWTVAPVAGRGGAAHALVAF